MALEKLFAGGTGKVEKDHSGVRAVCVGAMRVNEIARELLIMNRVTVNSTKGTAWLTPPVSGAMQAINRRPQVDGYISR